MGMLKEFKEFAVKGNVIDMAVGVIIGAAFGKIVASLVNDVIMPPIGMVMGKADFSDYTVTLAEKAGETPAVVLRYGAFINTVIDFTIMAFVVFIFVKQMNRLKKKEAVAPSDPTDKLCPECQMTIPIKAKRCGHCTTQLAS